MQSLLNWNINSLRVRLPHVLRLLEDHRPDVVCLQETRLPDAAFPTSTLHEAGYTSVFHGDGGAAGVAILSRQTLPLSDITTGFADTPLGHARRVGCRVGGIRVECVYVPTRRAIGKVEFLQHLRAALLPALSAGEDVVLCGDFNTCLDARDFAHPSMISEPERFPHRPEDLAFRALLDAGLADCFRRHHPEARSYTWFDYRMRAFQRNLGMRLDYIFASPGLHARCTEVRHDRQPRGWPRPSDHLPVFARFAP